MGFLSSIFGYVLNFLYNIFNNYGISIILFSILLRIILIPITIKQQKTMKQSAKIQEEMKEIQNKYKNNPEKLNQETMELYKREKMSPFSGCFSAILQLLILLSVFWLVSQPLTYMKGLKNVKYDPEDENSTETIVEHYIKEIQEENDGKKATYPEIQIIEKKSAEDERVRINMEFLGLDLSKVPTQSLNDWRVYIIPILYVITSFISIKITNMGQNTKKKDTVIVDGEDADKDQIGQMNNSMMYMLPIMSISIAIIAPLGLALYWLVSNVLMIIERLVINKFISSKEEEEDAK